MEELLNILKAACPEIDFSQKNLVTNEVIDSFTFVVILDVIEEKYGVKIDIDDIDIKDFESIENMFNLITKLIGK